MKRKCKMIKIKSKKTEIGTQRAITRSQKDTRRLKRGIKVIFKTE